MATNLVVGEVVQARIWCVDSEQASVNTLWYVVAAAGGTPATDQDVADNLNVTFAPLMKGLLNNLAAYHGVQVNIHNGTAPFRQITAPVFNNSLVGNGTRGAIALPRQTCGLLSFQTPFPGQAFRGRFYIPFPADADNQGGGAPGATYITNATALAGQVGVGQSIVASTRTATLARVLLHGPGKDGVTPPPTIISGTSVSGKWATQRRRGTFGRANSSPI